MVDDRQCFGDPVAPASQVGTIGRTRTPSVKVIVNALYAPPFRNQAASSPLMMPPPVTSPAFPIQTIIRAPGITFAVVELANACSFMASILL